VVNLFYVALVILSMKDLKGIVVFFNNFSVHEL
jgi:hypothetical protein